MLLLLPGQVTPPLTFRGVPESLARSTETTQRENSVPAVLTTPDS